MKNKDVIFDSDKKAFGELFKLLNELDEEDR